MKADQERVRELLNDTVTLLCKNGLYFRSKLRIEGVLGITIDDEDVFIVHINERVRHSSSADDRDVIELQASVDKTEHSKNSQISSHISDRRKYPFRNVEKSDQSVANSCTGVKRFKLSKSSNSNIPVRNNEAVNSSLSANDSNLSSQSADCAQESQICQNVISEVDEPNSTKSNGDTRNRIEPIAIKEEINVTFDGQNETFQVNLVSNPEFLEATDFCCENFSENDSLLNRRKKTKQVYINQQSANFDSAAEPNCSDVSVALLRPISQPHSSVASIIWESKHSDQSNALCCGEDSTSADQKDCKSELFVDEGEDLSYYEAENKVNVWNEVTSQAEYFTPNNYTTAPDGSNDIRQSVTGVGRSDLYESLYSRVRRSSALHTLKPYICPHSGCNLRFYHRNNVSRHCKLKHGGAGVKQRGYFSR